MNTGFQNERDIINELNNTPFANLSQDLQSVILKISNHNGFNSYVAKQYGGVDKADLSIIFDNRIEYTISVKEGSGNSVHQEPVDNFISYLKNNFEDNNEVFDNIKDFIWGDGTLDGTGSGNRITANQYIKLYPSKVSNIQSYFEKYKAELLRRFLITGAKSHKRANFLFYGNIHHCSVVSCDKLLDYALNIQKKPISIGVLNFQAWNRNIKRGNLSEKKRGQIQLKWSNLKEDIKKI